MGADPSLEPRTLAETLDDLHARGFTEHFRIVDGGWAWAIDAGRTFRPSQVSIAEWHRFEGVSDPEDMAIVYAIETGSGVRGTVTDAFGVYADPWVGGFMNAVARRQWPIETLSDVA